MGFQHPKLLQCTSHQSQALQQGTPSVTSAYTPTQCQCCLYNPQSLLPPTWLHWAQKLHCTTKSSRCCPPHGFHRITSFMQASQNRHVASLVLFFLLPKKNEAHSHKRCRETGAKVTSSHGTSGGGGKCVGFLHRTARLVARWESGDHASLGA